MPYIRQNRRDEIDMGKQCAGPGDLTYRLYAACVDYMRFAAAYGPATFITFAEVLGALSATEKEFYRRHVAPYEDWKIQEHGDV